MSIVPVFFTLVYDVHEIKNIIIINVIKQE